MGGLRFGLLSLLCGCGLLLDVGTDDAPADAGPRTDAPPGDARATLDAPTPADGTVAGDAPVEADAGDAAASGCGVLVNVAEAFMEIVDDAETVAPSLAWTGDGFGLVWHSYEGWRRLYYARLDRDGRVVGGAVPMTSGAENNHDFAVLAWTGADLGLAWEDSVTQTISFMRLAVDGTILGGPFPVTPPTSLEADTPALAWSGSGYGLAWRERADGRVYWRPLDADGTPAGPAVVLSAATAMAREPRVAASESAFAVAWHQDDVDGRTVRATSTSSAGTFVLGPSADDPDIAWTGSGWMVSGELDDDLVVSPAAAELGVATPTAIVAMVGDDDEPSMAWNGSVLGIAFEAVNGTHADIHFTTVDTAGAIVDPIRVVDHLTTTSQTPSLVWTGTRFAVAWSETVPSDPLKREVYFAWICP